MPAEASVGDFYRTRLTHTIEVAQIARALARALLLDDDLAEALALAHDLGHTPFGHAGQDVLNECMAEHGGFEHNLQSLRVVDFLEQRYGGFDGLNLTFETREGILKHCSRKNALQLGEVAERFIKRRRPSLEAQLVNLSDELAYNNHDVDDGLRSGLITLEQLSTVPIFYRHREQALKEFPKINGRRLIHETVRRMISTLVSDLTRQSATNIRALTPKSVEDVRRAPALIAFSPRIEKEQLELKQFLRVNLYQHYRVARMSSKARRIVTDLFNALIAEPNYAPEMAAGYDYGFKGALLDERLTFTISGFYATRANVGVTEVIESPIGSGKYTTATRRDGNQLVRGYEIDLNWRLGQAWSLNGSWGHVYSIYTDYGAAFPLAVGRRVQGIAPVNGGAYLKWAAAGGSRPCMR